MSPFGERLLADEEKVKEEQARAPTRFFMPDKRWRNNEREITPTMGYEEDPQDAQNTENYKKIYVLSYNPSKEASPKQIPKEVKKLLKDEQTRSIIAQLDKHKDGLTLPEIQVTVKADVDPYYPRLQDSKIRRKTKNLHSAGIVKVKEISSPRLGPGRIITAKGTVITQRRGSVIY